jgi:polar amino acid transport system permease protein
MNSRNKYRHTRSLLPFYRRGYFAVLSTLALVAIGVLVLPRNGSGAAALKNVRLAFFSALILVWAGNLLADKLKPMVVHILVAVAVIGSFLWMLFAYVGVGVADLHHIFFNFSVMEGMWPLIEEGVLTTLKLLVLSAVFATLLGLVIAVLRSLNNTTLNLFLKAYLEFFRAMPLLVILMITYFGLPFLNITLDPFTSGVVVLSLTNAAYISEVFRIGIASIHHTQTEASYALGMSFFQTMRLVLIPQAFRVVLPPLTNCWIGVLKDTAICSFVAIRELLNCAQIITSQRANPTPLVIATGIFLAMLIPLTIVTSRLERRYKNRRIDSRSLEIGT